MKSAKNLPSNLLTLLLLAACCACLCFGCTTVIPVTPESPSASFDNGVRNSGLVGWTNGYAIITPNAQARYNSLIGIYGNRFTPPIHPDQGICTTCLTNLILMQKQDVEHFTRMIRWRLAETP